MDEYDFLLDKGDKLINLSKITKLDIQDYINMRYKHLPTTVKWNYIKNLYVTEQGDTINLLWLKLYNSYKTQPIGLLEPPVKFIEWIIK